MINLVLPGGMSLDFYEPDGESDARALLQFVQLAISPFKVIFDAIDTLVALQDVLNAVVTDPLNVSSEVSAFISQVVKVLRYVPQISAIGVVKGGLRMTDAILAEMENILEQVEATEGKKFEVEAAISIDSSLADLLPTLETQIETQLSSLQLLSDGLTPITVVLSTISKLIGLEIAIPSFSCDSVSETRAGITVTRRLIARLLNNS